MIASILSALGIVEKTTAAKCQALARQGEKLQATAADAGRKLDAAQAVVAEHATRLATTENAYVAEPSDKNAKAVGEAREALELARLRTRTPEADKAEADRVVAEWQTLFDAVQAELAAEQEAARLVEQQAQETARLAALAELASVASYDALSAPAFARLRAALNDVRAAARSSEAAFDDANAAAAELTAAGVPTKPLDRFHLIKPFVLARVAAEPTDAAGLLAHYDLLAPMPGVDLAHGFAAIIKQVEGGQLGKNALEDTAAIVERINAAFACRTSNEARAAAAAIKAATPAHVEDEPAAVVEHKPEPTEQDDAATFDHDTEHFARLAAEMNARPMTEARR